MNPEDRILALAGKATPGPWHVAERKLESIEDYAVVRYCCDNHKDATEVAYVRGLTIHGPSRGTACIRDAKFIASLSPEVVAAMCRVIAKARSLQLVELSAALAALDEMGRKSDG